MSCVENHLDLLDVRLSRLRGTTSKFVQWGQRCHGTHVIEKKKKKEEVSSQAKLDAHDSVKLWQTQIMHRVWTGFISGVIIILFFLVNSGVNLRRQQKNSVHFQIGVSRNESMPYQISRVLFW